MPDLRRMILNFGRSIMDLNNALIRSHRNNLARYRRLLATQLTELERDYINRRIAEERDALQELLVGASNERSAVRPVGRGEGARSLSPTP